MAFKDRSSSLCLGMTQKKVNYTDIKDQYKISKHSYGYT